MLVSRGCHQEVRDMPSLSGFGHMVVSSDLLLHNNWLSAAEMMGDRSSPPWRRRGSGRQERLRHCNACQMTAYLRKGVCSNPQCVLA